MSLLGQSVRAYLLEKTSVSDVIDARMFPDFVPENNTSWPVIVYSQVSQVPEHVLSSGAGYAGTRLQLDIYAQLATARDALVEILRNELQGFAGTMGSLPVSSVVYLSSRDFYEPPQDSSDVGFFRNSTDYWFRHDQPAPTFA